MESKPFADTVSVASIDSLSRTPSPHGLDFVGLKQFMEHVLSANQETRLNGRPQSYPGLFSEDQLCGLWSQICVSGNGKRSRLTKCRSIKPLKILNPLSSLETCQIFLSNYGGGYVSGDFVLLDLEFLPHSRASITTQAESKVYKSIDGETSFQVVRARLGEGSVVLFCPDAVIPYEASRFIQQQRWALESDSNLVLVDWVHSGRSESGESFMFSKYQTEICIERCSEKIILDRFILTPESSNLMAAGSFGPYHSFCNVYLIGPLVKPIMEEVQTRVAGSAAPEKSLMSLSQVDQDVHVLRILAIKKHSITNFLRFLTGLLIRKNILDSDPLERKV